MSYTPDLTVDELATWFEKNQHKFIFFVYHGGGGGEFICNYLMQQQNVFYQKFDDKENPHNDLYNNINANADTNRTKWNNGSALAKSIQGPLLVLDRNNTAELTRHGIVSFSPKERNSMTWKQFAGLILKFNYDTISGFGRTITKKDLDEYDQQDLPILLRSHYLGFYHHLFKNSRILFQYSHRYQEYIRVLGMLKQHEELIKSHTLNKTVRASVSEEELKQTVINSIVYSSWEEDIYDHQFPIDGSIWMFNFNSDFLDYTRYLNYKIRFVAFEECFTGDWVTEEFGIDSIAFNNAIIQWDKNNTKFIKGLNTPPLLFRCPNQDLYDDTD